MRYKFISQCKGIHFQTITKQTAYKLSSQKIILGIQSLTLRMQVTCELNAAPKIGNGECDILMISNSRSRSGRRSLK